MCSIRCKEATSKKCKCECGGLNHGMLSRTHTETWKYYHSTFPPCTPVRLLKQTIRGTRKGTIKRFFWGKYFGWYAVLRETGEVVNIGDLVIEKEKK